MVAVTEIGGSGLAGMDHGALGVSDVLFNLRDYGAATASRRRTKHAACHVQAGAMELQHHVRIAAIRLESHRPSRRRSGEGNEKSAARSLQRSGNCEPPAECCDCCSGVLSVH